VLSILIFWSKQLFEMTLIFFVTTVPHRQLFVFGASKDHHQKEVMRKLVF